MKIFLDDTRNPIDCIDYMYHRIGKLNPIYTEDWITVRNYEQFKLIVEAFYSKFIPITHISFDHDLADKLLDKDRNELSEKTGYDCAKWFIEYYEGFGDNPPVPFPEMFVHSMNPVGTQNIINLFK